MNVSSARAKRSLRRQRRPRRRRQMSRIRRGVLRRPHWPPSRGLVLAKASYRHTPPPARSGQVNRQGGRGAALESNRMKEMRERSPFPRFSLRLAQSCLPSSEGSRSERSGRDTVARGRSEVSLARSRSLRCRLDAAAAATWARRRGPHPECSRPARRRTGTTRGLAQSTVSRLGLPPPHEEKLGGCGTPAQPEPLPGT